MLKKKGFLLLFTLLVFTNEVIGQTEVLYKQVDSVQLFLEVYQPKQDNRSEAKPAIVFFFGGGWVGGSRAQFRPHAEYFAQRGLVCFIADYRTAKQHGTSPFVAVQDAKSAIRYIKKNAAQWGVDSGQVIASGGSAGGHLAATTALLEAYNDQQDELIISSKPAALVLFNPVLDNGPGGYGYERIGSAYKDFSPLHNLDKQAPPTILFLGTKDNLIPVETLKYYQKVMEKLAIKCELHLYEGQGHGFFNYKNKEYYKKTVLTMDQFLQSLGYLSALPKVDID
jgi:acetyl esterase/lipase